MQSAETPEPLRDPAAPPRSPSPVPERFNVSGAVLRLDRFMTYAILVGGIAVIAAVFGIFIFIGSVIWPLFQTPHLTPLREIPLASSGNSLVGLDEKSELPYSYDGSGDLRFHTGAESVAQPLGLDSATQIAYWGQDRLNDRILLGTTDGRAGFVDIAFKTTEASPSAPGSVTGSVKLASWVSFNKNAPVLSLDYASQGERKLFGALLKTEEGPRLNIVSQRQKKGLMGAGKLEATPPEDLTHLLDGATPTKILLPGTADSIVVQTQSNELIYLFNNSTAWEVRQRITPFADTQSTITTMNFLYGDVSLVLGDSTGNLRIFSLNIPAGSDRRLFSETQRLDPLDSPIQYFVASRRNKSFVVASENQCALCYATTGTVRTVLELPYAVRSLCLDAKAVHLGIVDSKGVLHLNALKDPHPEAGWRTFFGKIWYEGYSEPKWEWQSTGGTDDFEPKLSLVPLIIGSIKGTLYAMFFAVPIALLAAIYTSQFLSASMKKVVKPAMEVMASLPSVVLGFLAALWLAPIIETKVPSILLLILSIPLSAMIAGALWIRVPLHKRNSLPRGSEFWLLAPLMTLLGYLAWSAGPALESLIFVAKLPDGSELADFRLWWPQFTGLPYDQRNCLVVGFMMGFAVIPVIFTIAEDALSNVPPALTSAAEALGASRWQVVRTVVLPIASAGIFSALMIGLGRAVGETMIVVMATGNTPVVDAAGRLLFGDPGLGGGLFPLADHWNIFSGMRTLSANIAVELPEAAQGSTHYRTLFLGAFALFLMTFGLNTAAELLRQRLREKFKIV